MSGQPRDDREWEHWPHERKLDDGIRHRLRGLFHPTSHGDEAVEEFVAQQGRELELRAIQLAETIADLERREHRTSELRVAVEQMLRRGSAELDERHGELAELAARLAEREALVTDTERLLAERRTELGAVELRRAALERREAAVSEREELLERKSSDLAEREQLLTEVEQRADELVARSTEVAAREERLTHATEAVERDREGLAEKLASLEERERDLSSLEERKQDLDQATAALANRQAALTEQREDLRRAVATLATTLGVPTVPATPAAPAGAASVVPAPVFEELPEPAHHLLFVPGDRYSLVEAEGRVPMIDSIVELEDHRYRVARIAPSPLPADGRRCAFLERL
jgi:DNA repair exonuclease SbcCD ATPase subunit